ncbi:uncharacterized protein N7459_002922 [Penicillium hispanicum]|uniref:uncharacterized protein n=1 Tax=Penicillium hispanicum TaxID=1080232 RepID=UPI00253FE83C|nr:uncharacterized protein N7459_002922 [Penicillium hispanicum]KAJ5587157.1 hypothetical protein N7459_002922 [Penicillium hispanicum]
MSFQPVNPRPFLQARYVSARRSLLCTRAYSTRLRWVFLRDTGRRSVGTELVIRLKWGQTEYKGTLESIDSYMNVLLRDTVEFIDGKETGSLGLVLIRYVSRSAICVVERTLRLVLTGVQVQQHSLDGLGG